jgi:PAS domain-containing protein
VRYFAQKDGLLLLLGAGFLGAGLLDISNALYSSSYFIGKMHSDASALVSWEWMASRSFLSTYFLASAIVLKMDLGHQIATKTGECIVFIFTAVIVGSCFLLFAMAELPTAYFVDFKIHRLEELLPGILFVLALIGFVSGRNWADQPTEYWIVMSLIVSSGVQLFFMPFSSQLFDFHFDAAYALKIVSYFFVLTGLLVDMRRSFIELSENQSSLKQQSLLLQSVLENIDEGISYYNSDLDLKLFNANYLKMQGIPQGTFDPGDNLEAIFRFRAENGEYGPCDVEQMVKQKTSLAHQFETHRYEHTRPNGQVIMVTGNPIGGDAMVASYRDVTQRVKQEQQLRDSEQTLHTRVSELEELKRALEHKIKYAMGMAEDLRQAKNIQHDAIQNISEGFALWDSNDKLVMCNDVFRRLYSELDDVIEEGVNFRDFITAAFERGIMVKADDKELSDAVAERQTLHRKSIVAFDEQLSAGR